MNDLPIQAIRGTILQTLQSGNRLILRAPTGSGKSTQVPQFICDAMLPPEKQIIVLQPRRMAARLLAQRIAYERNGQLGDEVGYQVRLEGQFSSRTKIKFVTEGLLLQRLLHEKDLPELHTLIFDEFHERHLETDLSLALALRLQKERRPDLKIIVMSATIECEKLQALMDNAPIIHAEGRTFPVEIRYAGFHATVPIWEQASVQLEAALPDFKEGNALIFMPGFYEIRKTIQEIQARKRVRGFQLLPLHGSLTKEEQDEAVRESDTRKIIVATNVAETSLTIPGIRLVIDSGLARIARYDHRRGINTLLIDTISQASADQRAGRAGRTGPGSCYRLWNSESQNRRPVSEVPEIQRLDLSESALGLIAANVSIDRFEWLEAPPEVSLRRAIALLQDLEAIHSDGNITEPGRFMTRFPMHPRFSRMLVEAIKWNCIPETCVLIALAQVPNILIRLNDERNEAERINRFADVDSDAVFEYNAWQWARSENYSKDSCFRLGIHAQNARQAEIIARQFLGIAARQTGKTLRLPDATATYDETALRRCILSGFSDHLALRTHAGTLHCKMLHGRSGQLRRDSVIHHAKLIVAQDMEETQTQHGVQILLGDATAIEESWLKESFPESFVEQDEVRYDSSMKRVVRIVEKKFRDLVLVQGINENVSDDEAAALLAEAVHNGQIKLPLWDDAVEHFINRVNFAAKQAPQYAISTIDTEARNLLLQQLCNKARSAKELERREIWPVLRTWLSYEQTVALDMAAPESLELPHTKRPVRLRYEKDGDVILAATVQQLYDCPTPVCVAEGKVPVLFEILAPNRRPIQITRDLSAFWNNSYHQIKKELKGRYPKHEWR